MHMCVNDSLFHSFSSHFPLGNISEKRICSPWELRVLSAFQNPAFGSRSTCAFPGRTAHSPQLHCSDLCAGEALGRGKMTCAGMPGSHTLSGLVSRWAQPLSDSEACQCLYHETRHCLRYPQATELKPTEEMMVSNYFSEFQSDWTKLTDLVTF